MLWFHPALATLTLVLALYVFSLGLSRFAANHLGGKGVFLWNRHVLLGKIVYAAWTLGFIGGAAMVRIHWPGFFLKGQHTQGGFVMLGLMALGLATGLLMDRSRKRRTLLPLVHGAANLLLLVVALFQAYTGWGIIQRVLLH